MTVWMAVFAVAVAGDDAAALREMVIDAVGNGARPTIYVDLFGRRLRGTVRSADEDGVSVHVLGEEVGLDWNGLGNHGLLKLAQKCASMDDKEQVLLLARFAVEKKMRAAGELLDRLRVLDPEAAKGLVPKEDAPPPKRAPRVFVSKPRAARPRKTSRKPRGASALAIGGWEPVGLSGGGWMGQAAISPIVPGLMMLNCDMSAAYISKDAGRTWRMIHHSQLKGNTRCRPGFHPVDPNVIFAVSGYSGKLKISRDQGEHWDNVGNLPSGLRGEIAIDPGNPNLMLTGVGEGVWRSTDGGKTWSGCSGPRGSAVGFHFDRTSPPARRILFAATSDGVWRSDDGGTTWTEKSSGLPWKGIRSFAGGSDRKSGTVVLYCAVPSRNEGGKLVGGVCRSTDRGETWRPAMGKGINRDVKSSDRWADGAVAQYLHVLTTDLNPRIVYAMNTNTGFWPPHHTTVFRSDDAGDTWRATLYMDPRFKEYNVEPNWETANRGRAYQEKAFGAAINPSDPDQVLRTMMIVGCLATDNGGRTWRNAHARLSPASPSPPGPESTWLCNGLVVTTTWNYYIDPFQPARHYITYTDIGFARSLDGGKSWREWNRDAGVPWKGNCYELAFDPDVPGKVWGAMSGIHDIPNGNIIWGRHGSKGPGGVCLSTDFCARWKVTSEGLPKAPVCSVVVDPKSPRQARVLYAGVFDHGVYKSTDGGASWTKKSEGLGAPGRNMRVYRVILHADGTLYALVTAMRQGGRFLKEGAGLYRSEDGARSWECITLSNPLLWPKDFTVHREDSRFIFVGAANAGDGRGGLYRTRDGGASWQRVAQKGPETFGAYFHPKRPGWVYMTLCEGAPGAGLWLSRDNGNAWEPLKNLPFSNVQRVTFDPADPDVIYLTTFGGSVWKGPAGGP